MRVHQFVTYVAVARQYQVDCGTDGVAALMVDTFKKSVTQSGGYAPKLTGYRPLSRAEADDLGLQPHTEHEVTWYRVEGSAIQSAAAAVAH